MTNKLAQVERFYVELVKQKRQAMNEQARESKETPVGQGVFRGWQRYINGLEFSIEKLGEILDMTEEDVEGNEE